MEAGGLLFTDWAISCAMTLPWNRPFSIKISLVCIPATITPARYRPRRSLSSVVHIHDRTPGFRVNPNPGPGQKLNVRLIPDERQDKIDS